MKRLSEPQREALHSAVNDELRPSPRMLCLCLGTGMTMSTSIDDYLDALASSAPTPGGGSAAGLVGATGAALVAMVARITYAAPRHAAVQEQAERLIEEADTLRRRFLAAGAADEEAYAALRAASTPESIAAAAAAPIRIAELAAELHRAISRGAALGNRYLASDLRCADHFARACAYAAAENVAINHRSMKDESLRQRQQVELDSALACFSIDP